MKKSSSNKIENEVLREQVESIQSDVNELKKAVEIMRFAVSSVRNSMNNIASVANTFSDPAQRIAKYLRHLHYAHVHGCCHTYYQFGKSGGDENEKSCLFTPRTQTKPCLIYEQQQVEDYKNLSPSQTLSLEYLQRQDKDNNGLIYGYDFIITPSDKDQPLQIRYLTKRISGYLRIPMLSWQTYLNTTPIYSPWQPGKGW